MPSKPAARSISLFWILILVCVTWFCAWKGDAAVTMTKFPGGAQLRIGQMPNGYRYEADLVAAPVQWTSRIRNDSDQATGGVSFTDDIDQGLGGGDLELICPPVQVPAGATFSCDPVTGVLHVDPFDLAPCSEIEIRYDTQLTAVRSTSCNGADLHVPGVGVVRSQTPLEPQEPATEDTCVFGNDYFMPLAILFELPVVDENGGTVAAGDTLLLSPEAFILLDIPFSRPVTYRSTLPPGLEWIEFSDCPPTATCTFTPPDAVAIRNANMVPNVRKMFGRYRVRVACGSGAGSVICTNGELWWDSGTEPSRYTDDPRTPIPMGGLEPTCVTVDPPSLGGSLLSVTDDTGDGTGAPGEWLTFRITVRDDGACPDGLMACACGAHDVRVWAGAPSGPAGPGVPLDGGRVDPGPVLAWDGTTTPSLVRVPAEGGQAFVAFRTQVAPDALDGESICCRASVTSRELLSAGSGGVGGCGDTIEQTKAPSGADLTCMTVRIPPGPFLVLTKEIVEKTPDGMILPSEPLTITLTLTNTGGGDAIDVSLRDALPSCMTVLAARCSGTATDQCTIDPGTGEVSVHAAVLGTGASGVLSVVIDVRAAADASGTCCNTAESWASNHALVSSDDPSTVAGVDPTCLFVVTPPDLADSTLDADPRTIFSGDSVALTLVIVNTGGFEASDAVATLAMPSCLSPGAAPCDTVAEMPAGASCATAGPSTVEIRGFTVAAGSSETIRFSVASNPAAPGDCEAQAAIACTGSPEVLSDDPANGLGDDDPTRFTITDQAWIDRGEIVGLPASWRQEVTALFTAGLPAYLASSFPNPFTDPEPVLFDTARPILFYQTDDSRVAGLWAVKNRSAGSVDLLFF